MPVGNRKLQSGFTFIELLVTLVVATILATIAVPSFQDMVVRNRLAADYNEVLSGLNYARSEAIKRREDVTFEVMSESPWQYRVSYPGDEGEVSIRIRSGQSQSVTLTGANSIKFNSLGRMVDGSNCFNGCGLAMAHDSSGCRALGISRFGSITRADCGGGES